MMRARYVLILMTCSSLLPMRSLAEGTNAPGASGPGFPVDLKGAVAGRWTMDLDAAKAMAKTLDRPVLLNFTGSDWCGYCKAISASVLSQPEWQEYASNRFVLAYLDYPKNQDLVPGEYRERNEKIRRQMGIAAFPQFVVLESDGDKILGQFGSENDVDPPAFMRLMVAATRARPKVLDAYLAGLPALKAEEYRSLLKQHADAEDEANQWLAAKPPRNEENSRVFEAFGKKIEELAGNIESFEINKCLDEMAGTNAVEGKKLIQLNSAYLQLLDELRKANRDLENWLLSRPDATPKSRDRLNALSRRVEEIQRRIANTTK